MTRRRPLPVVSMLVVVVGVVVAGCADTRVNLGEFDDTCTDDIQCAVVVAGDLCECGEHCGAIVRSELERYSDVVNDKTGCGFSVAPSCPDGDNPSAICSTLAAVCSGEGRCAVAVE